MIASRKALFALAAVAAILAAADAAAAGNRKMLQVSAPYGQTQYGQPLAAVPVTAPQRSQQPIAAVPQAGASLGWAYMNPNVAGDTNRAWRAFSGRWPGSAGFALKPVPEVGPVGGPVVPTRNPAYVAEPLNDPRLTATQARAYVSMQQGWGGALWTRRH